MRWLARFRHLWSVEEVAAPAFEVEEQRAKAGLEEQYGQLRTDEIKASLEALDAEDETPATEDEITPAQAYDVGEVEPEDLLEEEGVESHYSLNIVDADLEGSDEHLIDVEQIEPE